MPILTDPGTGSDLQGMRRLATKEGDTYKIHGSKTFIANGQLDDVVSPRRTCSVQRKAWASSS